MNSHIETLSRLGGLFVTSLIWGLDSTFLGLVKSLIAQVIA